VPAGGGVATPTRPRHTVLWSALLSVALLVVALVGFGVTRALTSSTTGSGLSVGNAGFDGGGSVSGAPFGGSDGAGNDGSAGSGNDGSAGSGTSGSSATSGSTATGSGSPSNVGQLAAHVDPAVVDIVTTFGYQRASGAGTGIVLTSTGEVLTNNHVIDGATSIKVTDVGNGTTYSATVVGYDPSADVAVLQLRGASGLATATIGDSSGLSVGDGVVAVGNAGGKGGTPSAVGGSVTALGRTITASDAMGGTSEQLSGLIQVNAAIVSGDSGGPLVDTAGEVVGMNAAASSNNETSGAARGFAIPINTALTVADQIESGQGSSTVHVGSTAFLGVLVATGHEQSYGGRFGDSRSVTAPAGATIAGVVSGGTAQTAGIVAGDTITSVGGHSVGSASSLTTLMLRFHAGDRVKVTWVDAAGQSRSATVALKSGPPA
jgi:S1-C subfamily serine protease